ncbi:ATPase [Nocardioides sp. Root1257]|uniref:sensor histidine kinase n=1 Tax=unclassified Nocardioides TaxID=2615069 RepID=UPI0006FCB6E8|nr:MULTISPECIES: ATP-binding protein [unclassified Nocardioides]KQW49120.1 ATPase [Nocardioides sp. Root1257]KRC48294.1 ATPase [Nocardioides sp. Root224]
MIRVRDQLRSLTSRLVLTTITLVLLVSVLIGTATTFAVSSYLTRQLDSDVHAAFRQVTRPSGPPGSGFDVGNQAPGTLIAVVGDTSQGEIISGERGAAPTSLSSATLDDLDAVPTDQEVHQVEVDGASYRVVAAELTTSTLIVGLPTEDVDDVVSNLIRWEIVLALVAVAGAGAAALVVVRRQLRPLREVAATAHAVSELPLAEGDIDLTERVPDHLTDERTEVGQVGSALNTLLEHVETSLAARHRSEQQVRQFVADASHELRTPLATIAGYTELARQRPDDPAMLGTALDKVEEESDRMTSLVEDLLLLARLDAGRPLEREPVDLTRLLVEAVSDARVIDAGHRWRVDLPDDLVDSPALVVGDELRLHQVVTNLLTNARKYTPAGTTVTVTVRRDGFAVHDDGPGFAPDLVDHAFERFARGDAARTRGQEVGVGLGLSLVDAIISAHRGRVTLRSVPGDTTIDVSLPGAPPPPRATTPR